MRSASSRAGGAARRGALLTSTPGSFRKALKLLPYVPVVARSGGLREYLAAAKVIAEYTRRFDAPPLRDLATAALWERWLIDPFGGPVAAFAAWLAAAGIVVAPRAARLVALAFLPLLLFSVASLNPSTAPRYVVTFLGAAPLAASLGLTRLRARRRPLGAVLGTAHLAVVALPAAGPLSEVAGRPSPPVAAMVALRNDPDLAGRTVLLEPALRVHWMELGRAVPFRELERNRPVVAPAGSLVVTRDFDLPGFRTLRVFRFESAALRRISRGRYLSVAIGESRVTPPCVGPLKVTDPGLRSSVDEPAEGAVVRAPLFVRGWCQETGGVLVVPAEFRVDGVTVRPESLVRTPRRDVSAAVPGIGETSRAGYEAFLPAGAVSPGEHVLEVVFETQDRRRVYPPRRFTLAAGGSPSRGSS